MRYVRKPSSHKGFRDRFPAQGPRLPSLLAKVVERGPISHKFREDFRKLADALKGDTDA